MDTTQLLIFRWGNEEYGVPVEDVSGITWSAWAERTPQSGDRTCAFEPDGAPIPIVNMGAGSEPEDSKRAIIMNSNGLQFAIVVDEVVKVTSLADAHDPASGTTMAPFRFWRFKRGAKRGREGVKVKE